MTERLISGPDIDVEGWHPTMVEALVRILDSHYDLLAALKVIVARIESEGTVQREGTTGATYAVSLNDQGANWADEFNAAEAAIAKAEGREK